MRFPLLSVATLAVVCSTGVQAQASMLQGAVDFLSNACLATIGNFPFIGVDVKEACGFPQELLDLANTGECNPIPIIGGNLSVKVDVGLSCDPDFEICANSNSVVRQLLDLLKCVVPNLGKTLSHVGTALRNTGASIKPENQPLLMNSALFLVYVIVKKVMEVLCLQMLILPSLVISLSPLLFVVLVSVALGLSMSKLAGLGIALGVLVLVLTPLLVGLVAGVSLLVLGLVIVLEPLLIAVTGLVILLLSALLGIQQPCATTAECKLPMLCGVLGAINDLLSQIPLTSFSSKLLEPVVGLVASLVSALGGLLSKLVDVLGSLLQGMGKN